MPAECTRHAAADRSCGSGACHWQCHRHGTAVQQERGRRARAAAAVASGRETLPRRSVQSESRSLARRAAAPDSRAPRATLSRAGGRCHPSPSDSPRCRPRVPRACTVCTRRRPPARSCARSPPAVDLARSSVNSSTRNRCTGRDSDTRAGRSLENERLACHESTARHRADGGLHHTELLSTRWRAYSRGEAGESDGAIALGQTEREKERPTSRHTQREAGSEGAREQPGTASSGGAPSSQQEERWRRPVRRRVGAVPA